MATDRIPRFPFLFGGTFIEGQINGEAERLTQADFPSFSEGLSLRGQQLHRTPAPLYISLPFRRDFH